MDLNFCCIQKTVIFKACRSYLILAANDNKSPSTMMQIQSTTHAKITTGTTHTNKRHCHAFVQKGAVQPLKLSWMQKLLQTSLCNPPTHSNSLVFPLLDDCRQLASQIPQIRFKHCYREANRVADHLARKGAKQNADFILFENPPVDLLAIFNFDLAGL